MARLESPALTLAEFGDENHWRSAWRFSHHQIRHIIRCTEMVKGELSNPEKIRIARKLLKAINERDCGTSSLRVFLSRKRTELQAMQERFNTSPTAWSGQASLYKVCD